MIASKQSTSANTSIALLTTNLLTGGAQRQLVQLAVALKGRGWPVIVILLRSQIEDEFQSQLADADILVIVLQGSGRRFDVRSLGHLRHIINAQQITILHSFLVYPNLLTRIGRLFYRVPVLISSARNIVEGGRWREILYRLTDPLCDVTTQNSQMGADRYVQVGAVPDHKMRYIPNSLDTDTYRRQPATRQALRQDRGLPDAFIWVAVGRLAPAKNYPMLLDAFTRLLKQHDAHLFIAGDGDLRPMIEQHIERAELASNVHLLGSRPDVVDWLNIADALVSSSSWEGMSNSLMEAMACELPVVTTETGAAADLITHGENGYLVPVDDTDALCSHMAQVMALSAAERAAMGAISRQRMVAAYSPAHVIDLWESLYRSLLSANTPDT